MESGRRRRWRRETRAPTDLGRLVPNRLSIELVPNRLSILEGRRGAANRMPVAGQAVPTTVTEPSGRPRTAVRPAGRRISLSTLVFIGFIAFWVLSRVLDVIPEGGAVATASPEALPTAGAVVFGTAAGGDCTVAGQQTTFTPGAPIWWSARFRASLPASQRVRWQLTFNGVTLDQSIGPTEPPLGPWDRLCGNDPLTYSTPGNYDVRVTDPDSGEILAEGTFTIE